jgi:hypothetical protein
LKKVRRVLKWWWWHGRRWRIGEWVFHISGFKI